MQQISTASLKTLLWGYGIKICTVIFSCSTNSVDLCISKVKSCLLIVLFTIISLFFEKKCSTLEWYRFRCHPTTIIRDHFKKVFDSFFFHRIVLNKNIFLWEIVLSNWKNCIRSLRRYSILKRYNIYLYFVTYYLLYVTC